jgi:hypothetical protein
MDWMKIGSIILMVAFIAVVFPRAMHALKHSPKGSQKDWLGALAVLGGVALFIWLLMKSV